MRQNRFASHTHNHACQKKKTRKTRRCYTLEWTVVSLLNEPSLERVREHKLLTSQASILKKETRASSLPEKGNYAARAFQRIHRTISRSVVGHEVIQRKIEFAKFISGTTVGAANTVQLKLWQF